MRNQGLKYILLLTALVGVRSRHLRLDINEQYRIALEGDKAEEEKLFDALLVRFRLFLYQRIRDESDAEDIAQDALMTIASAYKSVQIERSFAAWAYKVLDNKVLSWIKKRRKIALETEIEDGIPAEPWGADPDLKNQLLDCLRQLCEANNRYARTLNLHYQGFGTDEICQRLKVSKTNSYAILCRARALLKKCLEKGTIE